MKQNEMMNPWGISLKTILLFFIMPSSTSSCSSDPLFSFVAALYALILLYFPGGALCFSPAVILIAAIALLCLLRLGALQTKPTITTAGPTIIEAHKPKDGTIKSDSLTRSPDPDPDSFSSFVHWDVGAPLEVIYEEGEDHFPQFDLDDRNEEGIIRRYPSLSMYYPESDGSDSSSDDGGEFCGGGFRWDEEDGEGMLIEIDLDHRKSKGFDRFGFCGEEENMIEIDISPGKLDAVFSGEVCDY